MRRVLGQGHVARESLAVATAPELSDPLVHQYRYLLRTAPSDALEDAHREAFLELTAPHRSAVLDAVRTSMASGAHVTVDDNVRLAHLVVFAEKNYPGQFLAACPPEALRALADHVLVAEASFGLLGGYATWDGAEPPPVDDSAWADGGFRKQKGGLGNGRDQLRVARAQQWLPS
jgi:hypothetical protein